MDELEQNQEVIRADVNQLKEKFDRILEAIQTLARKENTDGDPSIVNEEHQTNPSHPPVLRPMKPLEPPFPKWYNPNVKCEYYAGAVGHSVEYCQASKTKMQELINAKWLTFKEDGPNVGNNPLSGHRDTAVNLIEEEIDQYTKDNHVLTIEPCMENDRSFPRPWEILYRKENPKPTHGGKHAIIVQAPTSFPYENNKAVPWSYEVNPQSGDSSKHQGTDVANISGIGGMIRSGRVYTPEQLRKKEGIGGMTRSGRVYAPEQLRKKESHGKKGKEVVYHAIKGPEICKKTVPTEEANKLLKFIKQMLVDNGSSLNVMPKSTLSKLFVDGACFKPRTMVVKAFDGSRRQVVGEIDLPIQIGPHNFGITFQVMNIKPAYSCLLGRPWIHAVGAVTSTLHQKLKFIVNNKLVIISGEEDMIVSHLSSTRYIEEAEEAIKTSFQALEIANVVFMEIPEKKDKYGFRYIPTKADQENAVKEKRESKLARRENRYLASQWAAYWGSMMNLV
ncbi:uncharacterized protein [Cicer arietinum]|uniref:uncharacterized protein n=1 Tax=Cicer arietinum TaxID=3827 RepID=UPI003CC577B6